MTEPVLTREERRNREKRYMQDFQKTLLGSIGGLRSRPGLLLPPRAELNQN